MMDTHTRVDRDILQQYKIMAAQERRAQRALVEEALLDYLNKHGKPTTRVAEDRAAYTVKDKAS